MNLVDISFDFGNTKQLQVMEMETEEGLRRAELAQADRDTTYKFNREVRREKSHWKIDSHRKNVILRNRPRYQAIINQVRGREVTQQQQLHSVLLSWIFLCCMNTRVCFAQTIE